MSFVTLIKRGLFHEKHCVIIVESTWRRIFIFIFSEKPQEYNDELSLNEYICLEEFRAKKGNTYYFCDFKPVKLGVIFDLSYNDVSIRQIKNILNDHINNVMSNIYDDIKSDPNFFKKYGKDKRKLM